MNLFLTLIIWFRTLFLLPIGSVKSGMNVYHASPVYSWFNLGSHQRRQSTSLHQTANLDPKCSFKQAAGSTTFILMVIWISIANLNLTFCVFTWAQFTRYVDITKYKTWFMNIQLHILYISLWSWWLPNWQRNTRSIYLLLGSYLFLSNGTKSLVDMFGEYVWTSAVFSIIVGIFIDLISFRLQKSGISSIVIFEVTKIPTIVKHTF